MNLRIKRKNHFLMLLFIVAITLNGFAQGENEIKQPEQLIFSYVSYEYGQPLQKEPDGFGIRRIYEVYSTKEIKVIDKLYDGYEITTKIKIDNNLYERLLDLADLKSLRTKEKLDNGIGYAGAYDYIAVSSGQTAQELCFILPLVSKDLTKLINSFYRVKLEAGEQKQMKETPSEIEIYKRRIVPIHLVSKLPLIELPPPPM